MNKYFIAAAALSLTAFTSANAQNTIIEEDAVVSQSINTQAVKPSTTETYMYMCNLGAVVTAVYDAQAETAKLDVHAPIWQLNSQTLTMQASPNDADKLYTSGKYQWRVTGEAATLSMKGSTVGDIKCEGNAISFL